MTRSLFSIFMSALLVMCSFALRAQTNIIPVRTDVSGFSSWTDANLAGTTYLQLLAANSSTISPAMDFNSYTGETLNFKARTFGGISGSSNVITVSISTDNGATWSTLGTRSPSSSTLTAMTAFNISSYNGTQVKIRFQSLSATGSIGVGIDDIDISGTAATCSAPTTQTSGFSITNITTGGFDASWTAGNGAGTMIVLRPTAQGSTAPANGTAYTANTSWASAGQVDASNRVVFRAAGSSVTGVSGLAEGTSYTVSGYEYSATDCYNTSAVSAVLFTLSTEPGAYAASFSATPGSAYDQVNLSFSPAGTISNADGYIVLQKAGSAPLGIPVDANFYTTGNSIGDATVAAVINSTSATSQSISGLSGNTNYYFTLVPFNWNSVNGGTFNYYTTGTPPTANVNTPSAPSTASDIIDNAGAGFYTTNIDYTQWQSATITSIGTGAGSGVGVFNILLRDGGAAAPDADAMPTTLTALNINYTGTAGTIRSAALFDGSTKIADGTVNANSIGFTGLSASAADDGTKAFTLAVTFNTTVTDNDKLVFSVSSATAAGTGVSSQFAAANAGSAASENNSSNDNNRIEVTATKLAFVQQPANTLINAAMSSVTVQAADGNNNRDLDYTTAVAITSSGTLSGSPVNVNAVSGLATFSGLSHTATGTGLTLTAASGSLASAVSNTFNISSFAGKLWDGGAGTGNWTDANNWEPNGVPTASDDVWLNNDLVSGNYTVTVSGNNNTAGRLKVGYAGNVNTITALITGGNTSNDALLLGNLAGDDLIVDDGGVVNNSSVASGGGNRGIEFTSSTCTWSMTGTGKFIHNQSGGSFINSGSGNVAEPSLGANTTVEIQKSTTWASGTGLGRIKHYGNLVLNFNTTFITAETYLASGDTLLVKGNMELKGGGAQIRVLNSNNATIVVDIRGNLTVGDACALTGSEGTGTGAKIIVGGNVTTSGTGFIAGSSGSGNPTTGTNEVILKGNFSGLYGSNSDQEKLTFDGNTTESTIQFNSSSDFLTIDINKPVKLLANIPGSRTINVNSGGTLNFNGFNAAGSGAFNVLSGGTLKITSVDGISATTGSSTGNVTTTSGARTFSTGGTYQFTGSAAQSQGTGLPATVAGFTVNNAAGVSLSQPVAVSGVFTLANGLLTTTATNIITVNAGATITGGSSSSFVNGPLSVKTSSTAAVSLPVGKGTVYGPVTITPQSSTASTYTAEYFNGAGVTPDSHNFGGSGLTKVDTFQYWDISRATGGADIQLTLPWSAGSNVSTIGDVVVAHYTGGAWTNHGQFATTGTTTAGTVTSGLISSFSPFTIGSFHAIPLAIKLSSFDAVKRQGSVALNWTTAGELSSDRFELERSENGRDFMVLTAVKANGHASVYNYTDGQPAAGKNYYRLAMIEADGKKQYSSTRIADMGSNGGLGVIVFPNPVTERLTVQALNKTAAAMLQLTDLTGKLLKEIQMNADVADIDMREMAPGIYLVRYTDGMHTELFKIVK